MRKLNFKLIGARRKSLHRKIGTNSVIIPSMTHISNYRYFKIFGNEGGVGNYNTSVDNDKFFVDQFGEYCRSVRGTCKTEVTFYGAPDQILSGTIWVKAPAYTTKKIDTGSNIVTLKERTGGIAGGCFIFKMVNKECKGRKTLAWSKPTIVVYAKERNPSDDF